MQGGGLIEVNTLADLHRWADHVVATLSTFKPAGKDVVLQLQRILGDRTMSGAFSGIETPTTGCMHMAYAFAKKAGNRPRFPKHRWVLEWNKDAIKELLLHPGLGPDCCVFGDIMTFVNPAYSSVIEHLKKNPHLAVDVLTDVVRSGALVKLTSWCYRHNRYCKVCRTDAHCAGTPCTPFSTQGSQKANEDPCVLFLLVWCALIIKLRIPSVLQENVSGFISSLLVSLMGHLYDAQWYVCDTDVYGWPSHRVRKYHGLILKDATMPLATTTPDPLDVFMREFHRVCNITCDAFWVAPDAMLEDLLLASLSKRKTGDEITRDNVDVSKPEQWLSCLLPEQIKRLNLYRELAPGGCYSLQQNPGGDGETRGFGAHSDEKGALHTMIKNCLPLWSEQLETKLLCHPFEIAGTQGLYVFTPERQALWPDSPDRKLSSLDVEVMIIFDNVNLSHARIR